MLVARTGSTKKLYTRQDDEAIIKHAGEGKSAKEIGAAIDRSEASVQYRITRVLNKEGVNSLDDIKYSGGAVAPAAPAKKAVDKK